MIEEQKTTIVNQQAKIKELEDSLRMRNDNRQP